MVRLCSLLIVIAALQAQPAQPPAAQPPPGTNIYLVPLSSLDTLKSSQPQPMATEAGYENQPFFAPDGNAVLFTANRDGKQTDIYEFDRGTRRTRALTTTPEGEYSPTVTPDGKRFSVIRVEADGTQRLWQFDRDGSNPRVVLADIKPVGYHAWIDANRLALFVLGKPATLQLADVTTGRGEVVASNVGRSLHRIPGRATVSVVHLEEGEYWIKEFDPATKKLDRLVRAASGSSDRDSAWLPDGTLLMSGGTRLFAWKRGDAAWREVYDAAAFKLGALSRIAAAADGRMLAIVASESKAPAF
jgi:Tol biopolymer transport system component